MTMIKISFGAKYKLLVAIAVDWSAQLDVPH